MSKNMVDPCPDNAIYCPICQTPVVPKPGRARPAQPKCEECGYRLTRDDIIALARKFYGDE